MRARLLYPFLTATSFVRDDLELLQEQYDVIPFEFGVGGAPSVARGLWRQRQWLKEELPRANAILGWFADYHLVLPLRMAGQRHIPLVVMLGGFDAACLPGLDYGVFCSRWRGPLARQVLRGASLLLPVGEALISNKNTFGGAPSHIQQGVTAHVSGLRTPAAVVPTGYEPDAWGMGDSKRTQSVCAVALISNWRTYAIKGADLLIEAARHMQEVEFCLVGVTDAFAAELKESMDVPPNVSLIPPVKREHLAAIYARTSVVAQLSRSEGLPNVLCEAMLCGCIPVVSAVGAMPELVSGIGEVVELPQTEAIQVGIRAALACGEGFRRAARDRIIQSYSRDRRRRELFGYLDALLDGERPGVPACDWPLAAPGPPLAPEAQ